MKFKADTEINRPRDDLDEMIETDAFGYMNTREKITVDMILADTIQAFEDNGDDADEFDADDPNVATITLKEYAERVYDAIQSIPIEERVMRCDLRVNYTEHDIRLHLKDGVFVYESYEEFLEDWVASLCDEDEAKGVWDKLNVAVVDGKEYRYDLAL